MCSRFCFNLLYVCFLSLNRSPEWPLKITLLKIKSRFSSSLARQPDEEEAFDWTSYLLADLPPLKRFADDFPSDEEWSEEEEESVLVPLPGGTEGDLSGDESTLRESSMGLSRLSEGVVNEYWKDKEKCLISSGRRAGDIPHDWYVNDRPISLNGHR